MREAGAVIANAPERLIKTETALSAEAGVRAGAVLFRALSERIIYTIEENKSRAGLFLSYPELWRGNPLRRISLAEFDADQAFRSPYHRAAAAHAISNDHKGKLRRDAQWADHLERCTSVGLVTNETGDRAPVELDAS